MFIGRVRDMASSDGGLSSGGSPLDPLDTIGVPTVGKVFSILITLAGMGVLCVCIHTRLQQLKRWRVMSLTQWLTLGLYLDSFCFVTTAAILNYAFDGSSSWGVCNAVISGCIGFYFTTKLMLYIYLIEKAFIVRVSSKPRLKSKFYTFTLAGVVLPYISLGVICIMWRFSDLDDGGTCNVGIQSRALMPLVIYDLCVNMYLTACFVLPIRALPSFQSNPKSALRVTALRSLIGCVATMIFSSTNIVLLLVLKQEKSWICLLSCSTDVLFTTVVVCWISTRDTFQEPAAQKAALCPKCGTGSRNGSDNKVRGHGGSAFNSSLNPTTTNISSINTVRETRVPLKRPFVPDSLKSVIGLETSSCAETLEEDAVQVVTEVKWVEETFITEKIS